MDWFYISLISPLMWAIVAFIDKFLLSRFFKGGGVGSLTLISTLFSIVVSLIAFILSGMNVGSIPILNIFLLLSGGLLNVIGLYTYFLALEEEDASLVIPYFQIIPIFGLIFAWMFLGEVISTQQIFAGILILSGVTILSLEFEDEQSFFRFKKNIVLLMLTTTLCYSFYETLFKVVTPTQDLFWQSIFWQSLGSGLVGCTLLTFLKKWRKDMVKLLKDNSFQIVGLNVLNEIFYVVGNLCLHLATLSAPVALVMILNSLEPFIGFILGGILTILLPSIFKENITLKNMAQKLLAVIIIFIGTFFIYIYS